MTAILPTLIVLFCSMVFDLRKNEVPSLLTIGFLFGSKIYAIIQGIWTSILLVVVLISISDLRVKHVRVCVAFFSAILACFNQPVYSIVSLSIFGVWL